MFSAGLAGMSIGPCAAAATFAVTGNAWHVQTLQHVILVGMVLAVIPILALLCFDDDHSLGAESNAVRHQPTPTRSPVSGMSHLQHHHKPPPAPPALELQGLPKCIYTHSPVSKLVDLSCI